MASSDGDSTENTNPPSSFFRNRFSNASLLTLASVRTLLPQYSIVDTLEDRRGSAHSDVSTDNHESPSGSSPTSDFPSSGNAVEPPRYSLANPRRSLILTWRASTATRFEIEDDPQAHEFRYSYTIRPKNPWATLHLHTRDTVPGNLKPLQNQPRVPRFWSCDPVTGTLQLDLDSPQNIQQINISLHGNIILSSHFGASLQFLDHEFTLWDKSMGDPLQSDNTDSKGAQKKKSDGRLVSGQYTFPFSFPFPTHIDPSTKSAGLNTSTISPFPPSPHTVGTTLSRVASPTPPLYDYGAKNPEKAPKTWTRRFSSSANEGPSSPTRAQTSGRSQTALSSNPRHSSASPMPQTFLEKDISPNVSYDISVRIVHGRFRASSKIKTNIAYIPASEPLPASQKRREAYEAGGLLPCPMDDPEGWFALPTATIYGVVKIDDGLLHTRVDCTLYIAEPLSYTRGSVIPCFITIYSDGVEVERLLSSTETPTVRLLRRVRHPTTEYETPGPEASYGANPTNSNWAHVMVPSSDMKLVTHEVGSAKWWIPSKDVVQGPDVRHLEGEIHLNPDSQPSCDFQLFQVEYAVELLSFQTANFKADIHPPSPGKLRNGDNVIASNPVEITTVYRQGEPVPTAYSEPPKTHKVRCVSPDKSAVIFAEDK